MPIQMCHKHDPPTKLICPRCIAMRSAKKRRSKAQLAASHSNLALAHRQQRKYPPCPRYGKKFGSHRFSPATGICPCGWPKNKTLKSKLAA